MKPTRSVSVGVFILALLGVELLVAACGGEATTTTAQAVTTTTAAVVTTTQATTITTQATTTTTQATTATTTALVPMSTAMIGEWKTNAAAFGNQYFGAWPDADAEAAIIDAAFADDSVYYDPSNDEYGIKGKQANLSAMRMFFAANPTLQQSVTGMYVSQEGAAYSLSASNGVLSLQVFPYENGRVAGVNLWYQPRSLETWKFGVFAPGEDGSEQLEEIADGYLAAWASGNKSKIAALYHKEAKFSDTMLGLQAKGPEAIAALGFKRFGSDANISFEIIDLYAQINGSVPPTASVPENGVIIGVGIHYRCNSVVDGKPATIESFTTLELGTRAYKFVPDPNGLIVREEVFHNADSLLASGLVD